MKNAERARKCAAYLSSAPIAKITTVQAALLITGADFTASAITAFLAQVVALIALPAYAGGTLAAAVIAAAPIVTAIVDLGGTAPSTLYISTARAYVAAVATAAETALAGLVAALALPVDPLPGAGTEADRLVAALIARFSGLWFTRAQADPDALVMAGVGAAGVRTALDQAASTIKEARLLYPAAEAAYAWIDTFGIRTGE